MLITGHRRGLCRSGAAALMAAFALVLGGCGGSGTAGPERGADVADIQDEPVDDDSIFFDGDVQSFVGQEVTLSAAVTEVIGPNAFTIAGENAQELLVVHDGDAQITVDTPIRVTGTVIKAFAIPDAEEFTEADLEDGPIADFDGEPYVQATAIDTDPDFSNE